MSPKPDFTTITDVLNKEVGVVEDRILRKFWRSVGVSQKFNGIPFRLRFKRFHLSTKMGPNGPQLDTLVED